MFATERTEHDDPRFTPSFNHVDPKLKNPSEIPQQGSSPLAPWSFLYLPATTSRASVSLLHRVTTKPEAENSDHRVTMPWKHERERDLCINRKANEKINLNR